MSTKTNSDFSNGTQHQNPAAIDAAITAVEQRIKRCAAVDNDGYEVAGMQDDLDALREAKKRWGEAQVIAAQTFPGVKIRAIRHHTGDAPVEYADESTADESTADDAGSQRADEEEEPEPFDTEVYKAALEYKRDRGWAVVPIPFGERNPWIKNWPQLRLNEHDITRHFTKEWVGVGVMMGLPSGKLADTDFDCDEAIAIAPYFFPDTGLIFGRPSKRQTHRLYVSNLCHITKTANIQFKDPNIEGKGAVLLEIRCGRVDKNGTYVGAQTVLPPSLHKEESAGSGSVTTNPPLSTARRTCSALP
jgi:hypothetical protein